MSKVSKSKGKKTAVTRGKSTGTSMGGMEYTKGAKARHAKKLRSEEDYWASLAGPVTVRKMGETKDGI
jgi:hypothetical protein